MFCFKHCFSLLCICLCFQYSTFATEQEKTDLDYIKQFSRETMLYFGLVADVSSSKEEVSKEFKSEAKKMSELGDEYDLFESSKESWDYILSGGEPWFEYFSCTDKELLSRWNLKKIIKMQVGPLHVPPRSIHLLVHENGESYWIENNQDILEFLKTKHETSLKGENKGLELHSTRDVMEQSFFIILLQNGTLFGDIDGNKVKEFVDYCSRSQIYNSSVLSKISKETSFDNSFGSFSLHKKHGLWIVDYVLATNHELCEFRKIRVVLENNGRLFKIEDKVVAHLRNWKKLSFPTSPTKLWKPITLPKLPSDETKNK